MAIAQQATSEGKRFILNHNFDFTSFSTLQPKLSLQGKIPLSGDRVGSQAALMPSRNDFMTTPPAEEVKLHPNGLNSPATRSTKRVLLIDDEAPLRRVTQLTLKITAGWEVLVASSSSEGLEQAQAEQPDAILLDLMMPDVDGVATLIQLRENPQTQHIPVILLTAKVQVMERSELDRFQVAAVLLKPFDPTELAQQIKDILGWN